MAGTMSKIPRYDEIEDAVAQEQWSYVDSSGEATTSRITIGRPRPWSSDVQGEWLCLIEIEHRLDGVQPVFGAGPVEALMNAMDVVKAFADQIGKYTPRANEH